MPGLDQTLFAIRSLYTLYIRKAAVLSQRPFLFFKMVYIFLMTEHKVPQTPEERQTDKNTSDGVFKAVLMFVAAIVVGVLIYLFFAYNPQAVGR